jgi:hypothetical protein
LKNARPQLLKLSQILFQRDKLGSERTLTHALIDVYVLTQISKVEVNFSYSLETEEFKKLHLKPHDIDIIGIAQGHVRHEKRF